jgi:cytoskeletal protein RodZ
MTQDERIDKASLSFGRYLQQIRLEKGISLEVVSKETRIRPDILYAIEEENHEKLPDEVFVRGFLRSYAKAIGAEGDEAVRRYNARLGMIRRIDKSDSEITRTSRSFWPRLLLALAAMVALIGATLFGVSYFRGQGDAPSPPSETVVENEPAAQEPAPPAAIQPSPSNAVPAPETPPVPESAPPVALAPPAVGPASQPPPPSDKLSLKIEAVEETWMKIIIDDQEASEFNLYPGDRIELEAESGYNLLIGNAGGIRMFLNDEPVEIPGDSGDVVNLELPR